MRRAPAAAALSRRALGTIPSATVAAARYLRISFARPLPELREGATRIAAFLQGR